MWKGQIKLSPSAQALENGLSHMWEEDLVRGCKSNAVSLNAAPPARRSDGMLASTNPNCSCWSIITTFIKVENLCREESHYRFFFLPLFCWFYWVKEKPINRARFNHLPNTWTQGLVSKGGGLVWKETWPTSSKSTLERVPSAHVMHMHPINCPGKILSEWNGCLSGHQGNITFNLCSICCLICLDWPCSERNQIWPWLRNPCD